ATQKYVNDTITAKITAHEKSTNHPNATTSNKGFVQLNSAINSKLETQAATPLAVKKVYDKVVKRAGDTMTGQLTLSNNGLKINYANNDSMTLMTLSDKYSHSFYDAKTNTSKSKLDYNSTQNIWQFKNVKDVTINDKSVLKAGDHGIGTYDGARLDDPEKRLLAGFYGTNTDQLLSSLPNVSGSGTLAVYGSETQWTRFIEQLYIAETTTPRTPRLFSRCGAYNGKDAWVESITEANIDRFLTTPVGVPQPWPRSFAPKGYLLCNGASFDANKYPKLSYAYPNGKLPDLRKWDGSKDIQFIYIVKAE
ncbi:Phage tail fiber repeat protein, partial [Gilliamella apicola SCGC AB-598-B02]